MRPPDPAARARSFVRKHELPDLEKASDGVLHYMFSTKEEERDEEKVRGLFAALFAELDGWEGYLSKTDPWGRGGGPYFAGERFSHADIALYPGFAFLVRVGLDTGKRYPAIGEWHARVTERPSVQASWPPHWKDSKPWDRGFAKYA